ncbi:MAG TPA: phage tail tip lysozyme [Kofleriaceae bacterium]|jgi:hypothetical protein|nr:phage tail tip lysozyme [Kofleriaceae bacterium]
MHNHTRLSITIVSITALSLASGAQDARGAPAASPGQTAFNFFVRKGLSKVQAAGVVGNLVQESGIHPGSVEAGGPGRGIAQWSLGGRWDRSANDNLRWYAAMHRMAPGALDTQLDFIWYELMTFRGYGLAALRAASTVAQATHAFAASFEACGACNEPRRIAFAQSALRAYGGATRIARRRP